MTALGPDASLGWLVAEYPGLARVFDRFGLDYCCGGRATLAQACEEKGLDLGEVVRELASNGAQDQGTIRSDGTTTTTLGMLADTIVATHHAYLKRELPRLSALTAKVADAHAVRHPELHDLRQVFEELKEELESHMLKEEKVLFPIIKQLEEATAMPRLHCGSVNNPILVMEHEHTFAGSSLQRMRFLTGGYQPPDDSCASYKALMRGLADLEMDLHRHIHKENNILFPGASALEASLRDTP